MPLNSAEIAQSVGMYQQQYAQQMGYSGMIGGGGMPQVQAESMGSGILNRGMAIGGPVASLAMGMAGVDPLSTGMWAARFGASRLGFGALGAGAMGIGAATGVGAAMAVGGFAANQMYTGMQQQQQFNQSMRQSFNFISPAGQGFSGSQLGQISQQIRGMAGESGPAGQMTSFGELTKLAAGMGQMGMAQGVRDVQEFGKRFRQMVDTLKTVSKELGTSLEASQQFVSGLRGSGIFNQADQIKAAMSMRAYSASGTIAVSEISAMGNIGSQISRSVGGRGRSGAMAGMKTMGMVGAAIDAGAINEEDIYNATGLTGAEGRQAYATAQLGSAANFLKTGKGRYFLASVAGENGKLDANSVSEWMSGDVGVGRTKGMAGSNLGKVGRANFIRNEGRLRGAALEQFGGMLPAMALSSWASERGIDINTMNDREMLFASRQLGIGMDQLEGTVKQVQAMPQMMKQLRMTRDASTYLQNQGEIRKTQGIEGAKRAFEHARDKVQNALQETGANFYTDLTSFIETSINRMSDMYVEQASKNIQSAYENAKRGNKAEATRMLGLGGSDRAGSALLGGRTGTMLGNAPAGASYDAFNNRGIGGIGTSDRDRMAKAGYGGYFTGIDKAWKDPAKQDQMVAEGMAKAEALHRGALGKHDDVALRLGSTLKSDIQDAYGLGGAAGKSGLDRVQEFDKMLSMKAQSGDKVAAAALKSFRSKKTDAERANFVESAEAGAGIAADSRLSAMSAPGAVLSTVGGAHSLSALDKSIGEKVMGKNSSGVGKLVGGVLGAGAGVMLGPIGMAIGAGVGAWAGEKLEQAFRGTSGRSERSGGFLRSDRGQELIADMMSANKDEQAKAREFVNAQLISIQSQKAKGTEGLEGDLQMFGRLSAVQAAMDLAEKNKRQLTPSELEGIAKDFRKKGIEMTGEDISSAQQGMLAARDAQVGANRRAVSRMYGARGRERMREYSSTGVMNAKGEVSADVLSAVRAAGGAGAEVGVLASLRAVSMESKLTGDGGPGDMKILGKVLGTNDPKVQEKLRTKGFSSLTEDEKMSLGYAQIGSASLDELSVAQKRKVAAALREKGEFGLSQELSENAGMEAKNLRSLQRGGVGLAGALGVQLSRDEKRAVMGMRGEEGAKKITALLAAKMGVTSQGVEDADKAVGMANKDLAEAEARASRAKGTSGEQAALRDVEAAKERQKTASSAAKDAALSDPVRKRLEDIAKLQQTDPAKAATELRKFQQSDDYRKLEERKKEKEDANNPMVRGHTALKDAIDPLKGVLQTGFANVVRAVKKGGDGGDEPPTLGEQHASLHRRHHHGPLPAASSGAGHEPRELGLHGSGSVRAVPHRERVHDPDQREALQVRHAGQDRARGPVLDRLEGRGVLDRQSRGVPRYPTSAQRPRLLDPLEHHHLTGAKKKSPVLAALLLTARATR